MKKIKLLTTLAASSAILATSAPALTSCKEKEVKITPTIDETTKTQFEQVETNCILNKQSTIKFVCKQGQELDASSLEIKVNNKNLEIIKDYKIESNNITIYYYAMSSTNVSIKANAKNSHVISKIEHKFINTPVAINDTLSPNDLEVKLTYKDGETEILPWGLQGYRIYRIQTIDGQEVIEEVENFSETPYRFDEEISADKHFHFDICYTKDETFTTVTKELIIGTFNKELFLVKYQNGLDNYASTISSYSWMIFDSSSTYKGENVVTASVEYNESQNAIARFKDSTYVTTENRIQIANYPKINISKLLTEEYNVADYNQTYTNSTDSISVYIEDKNDVNKYLYLEFDNNSYLKSWINLMGATKEYNNTKITHVYYQKTAKVATLTPQLQEPARTVLSGIECCDPLYPTNIERVISETDNRFKLKVKCFQDYTIYGRCFVYNGANEIYSGEIMELDESGVSEILIEINDWSKISHDADLTVEFKLINYAKVSLGSDTTTKQYIDYLEFDKTINRYVYDGDDGYLRAKINTIGEQAYQGTFYLTETQNASVDPTDDTVFGRSDYYDKVSHRGYIELHDIDWTKIDDVNKQLYLHFYPTREFTWRKGETLDTYFPDQCEIQVSHQKEDTRCIFSVKVKNTLETTINHTGKFIVQATRLVEEEEEIVEVCSTVCTLNNDQQTIHIVLQGDDWNKFKDRSELTVQFKTDDTDFNVEQLAGDVEYNAYAGQPLNGFSFERFMYSNESGEELDESKIWISNMQFNQVSVTGDILFTSYSNSSAEFVAGNKIKTSFQTSSYSWLIGAPNDGDTYQISNMKLCFESDRSYKEWTFDKIKVIFRVS